MRPVRSNFNVASCSNGVSCRVGVECARYTFKHLSGDYDFNEPLAPRLKDDMEAVQLKANRLTAAAIGHLIFDVSSKAAGSIATSTSHTVQFMADAAGTVTCSCTCNVPQKLGTACSHAACAVSDRLMPVQVPRGPLVSLLRYIAVIVEHYCVCTRATELYVVLPDVLGLSLTLGKEGPDMAPPMINVSPAQTGPFPN